MTGSRRNDTSLGPSAGCQHVTGDFYRTHTCISLSLVGWIHHAVGGGGGMFAFLQQVGLAVKVPIPFGFLLSVSHNLKIHAH